MQDRHYTERQLSLKGKGPCEACSDEESVTRAFFSMMSKVVCGRRSLQWRGWRGPCDWCTLLTSDMDEEECEQVWTEFVNHIADHDKEVELSKQRRAKGHCVACPATFETTKMRSLPENFFPNEVKEDDVICTQCLTWFSSNRTRKLYDWQNLQDFIDTRTPIYEESTKNAAIRAGSKLCECSTDENPVEGTALMKIFSWLDRHPKLCRDCAGFWGSYYYKKSHIWTTYDFSTLEKFTEFFQEQRGMN